MSHIYVYSPSSAVRDKTAFRRGVARLKALGHEVEVDQSALCSHTRFAGADAVRLAAISRAAASAADLALISRGGYGLTRLLAALPCAPLARAIERGMQFVGMSDFTALQCALYAQTGAQTWAGPCLLDDFGTLTEPDDIMAACFDDLLAAQGEGSGWRLPAADLSALAGCLQGRALPAGEPAFQLSQATLWGGNLSVLCALVGTPYLPAVKGGVLFLEDVNEHPYRIERMLSQLLHAGILGQQSALLLGSFNRFELSAHDRGFSLAKVVNWLRSQIRIPVLSGLPFGHVPTKVLLPFGRRVDLLVQGRQALLYWG